MAMLSQPAFGPRTALSYITAGTLLDVWTLVWYFAFARPEGAMTNTTWFWIVGLFLTGTTLIVIGVLLGPISQSARKAELPPTEAINAEAQIQRVAAAVPQPVVTTAPQAVQAPVAAPAPPAAPAMRSAPVTAGR